MGCVTKDSVRPDAQSYSDIAETLGSPRAVANACASNPVALAIPCHRVVHKDGALAGYRWGTARKVALLSAEKEHRVAAPLETVGAEDLG